MQPVQQLVLLPPLLLLLQLLLLLLQHRAQQLLAPCTCMLAATHMPRALLLMCWLRTFPPRSVGPPNIRVASCGFMCLPMGLPQPAVGKQRVLHLALEPYSLNPTTTAPVRTRPDMHHAQLLRLGQQPCTGVLHAPVVRPLHSCTLLLPACGPQHASRG